MSLQVISGNPELDTKITEWLTWDRNPKTLEEIRRLVAEEQFDELGKKLMTRLRFGTAGLRGKLGPGYNAINDLVIIQTAQGLLEHLEESEPVLLKANGIVVGYDGRYGSKKFAELTATVFITKGFQVRLFNNVVPTPFVPFTVGKYKAAAGVMVTASHNPKEDNGYKVYGSNGAQIINPVDAQIEAQILGHLKPLTTSWETSILINNEKLTNPLPAVMNAYLEMIKGDIAQEHMDINGKSDLKFVYTPLHGVGYVYFARAMEVANLELIPVEEQKDVDPDFPTVSTPNPEEGPAVLKLAMQTAEANQVNIVIANDPDVDRMICAEKDMITGKWKIFNGNELGALLSWWALYSYRALPNYDPEVEVYMLASTVSSKILSTMSQTEGFKFIETLTGFKWMGNKAYEIMQSERKKVIFSFEEAIGFMWNGRVLDKDGIQAGVHLACLAAYLHDKSITLTAQLEKIYQKYGYHISLNSFFLTDDVSVYNIFRRLRNFDGAGRYPKVIGGKYNIKHVRDLTLDFDSNQPDNKAILPISADHMITFEFENGLIATLRTSGTEPKLKIYTEMCAKPNSLTREKIYDVLRDMVHWLIEDLCEPTLNGLKKGKL